MIFNVSWTPLHFHTIQPPQMGLWRGINSPRHLKSRWLTATEKCSIRWTDAMLFRASVHPVPSKSLSHCSSADTTVPMLYTDGASVHPMQKNPRPKCLLASMRPSDRPTLHLDQGVGSSGAEDFVLAHLCIVSTWASDRPTMSSLRLLDHPVLLSLLLFLRNSSSASTKWTVGSSDGVNFVWLAAQCTNYTDTCYLSTVGSSDGVFSFSFLSRFCPLKNSLSSQFGMWYFGILGT
jgi:hypothetical protein